MTAMREKPSFVCLCILLFSFFFFWMCFYYCFTAAASTNTHRGQLVGRERPKFRALVQTFPAFISQRGSPKEAVWPR